MKHDAALRALMGESKAQQKQRLQERLEQLRKLKQEGGEVDEGQMAALEQVEAEGVDAVDAEVLNQLIEETMTETEEVTTSTLLNDLSVRPNLYSLACPFHLSSPYSILSLSLSFPLSPFLSIPFPSPLFTFLFLLFLLSFFSLFHFFPAPFAHPFLPFLISQFLVLLSSPP